MSRPTMSCMRVVFLLALTVASIGAASAAGIEFPRNGWVSWDIDTVDGAPNWCCFDGRANSTPATCALDGRNHGYGSRGDDPPVTKMRVHARFHDGKVERLRTLATTCAVSTDTPVTALNTVSASQSLAWLRQQATPRNALSSDALATIAVQRGDGAAQLLASIAGKDGDVENRKDAMFWATQVRGDQGLGIVLPLLASDASAEVRRHAAFAVAQTKAPSAIDALIKQGQADTDAEVRSQAWFWLAQTGDTRTEGSIASALAHEPSRHVRDQAVFALSQLPEPRNVRALIKIAEDHRMARAERKQAIFWLGQAESEAATRYLDRVLAGTASR